MVVDQRCFAAVRLICISAIIVLACNSQRTVAIESVTRLLAKEARDWMDSQAASEISLGTISQPPGTTTGQGIGEMLVRDLRLENLTVKSFGAPYYIQGSVAANFDEGYVVFEFAINSENGKTVKKLSPVKLALAGKVSGSTNPGAPDNIEVHTTDNDAMRAAAITARNDVTLKDLRSPAQLVAVQDERVYASGRSQLALAILLKVNNEFRAIKPSLKGGVAVVELPDNGVYAVKLINDSDDDVAVILEIDGVNFFVLCDAKKPVDFVRGDDGVVPLRLRDGSTPKVPAYTHYCISKRDDAIIYGWYKNEREMYSFRAVSDPVLQIIAPSVKANINARKIGTITAQFYRAWTDWKKKPDDAIVNIAAGAGDNELRTIPGELRDGTPTQLREYYWEVHNRATVSVRYEKRQ